MSEIENDEDSEASDSLGYNRLNRWNGAYRTWQKYTEHERGLAASLDQIRNSDLSVHLYNAHALKKRAKEYEENPQTARVNKEHPTIPESDRIFKPPKYWTAWPLAPEDVPREDDIVGPNDSYGSYTLAKKQIPWPSRELEDILMGVTLRGARSRFENRVFDSEDDASIQEDNESEKELTEGEKGDDLEPEALDNHQNQSREDNRHPNEQLKPAISLDDERSRELLRPSMRHSLSRLDDMLMALHHARMTCRRYSQSDAGTTDDENATKNDDDIAKARLKRPRGRPRKFADLPDRSRGKGHFINLAKDDDEVPRLKKTQHGRGRPRKVYERLDGETQQDYMVRIARLQKKPLPPFAPSQSEATNLQSPSNARTSRSKSPRKRANSEELRVSRQKKLGLRDWSEVLGAAALVGFSPNVIARATRRCANLFDEGMEMRHMIEMPFSEKEPNSVTRYVPEIIPDFDAIETQLIEDDFEASNISSSEAGKKPKSKIKRTTKTSGRMTFFCPILGCPRKVRGFRDNQSLRRHLQKGHKIGPSEIDEYILPSDEEMDGAVHVDGFLKPIRSHKQRQEGEGTRKHKAGHNTQTNNRPEREHSSLSSSENSDGWSPSE